MKFSAILLNIEGLNDKHAKKINEVFIGSLGRIRHNDNMAFYRDLQPVCREVDCRARLVDGVTIKLIEGEDENKCEFNLVCMGEEKEFNAILVTEFDGSVHKINRLYLFVPNEKVSSGHDFHITVESVYGDEITEGEDNNDQSAAGSESDN